MRSRHPSRAIRVSRLNPPFPPPAAESPPASHRRGPRAPRTRPWRSRRRRAAQRRSMARSRRRRRPPIRRRCRRRGRPRPRRGRRRPRLGRHPRRRRRRPRGREGGARGGEGEQPQEIRGVLPQIPAPARLAAASNAANARQIAAEANSEDDDARYAAEIPALEDAREEGVVPSDRFGVGNATAADDGREVSWTRTTPPN